MQDLRRNLSPVFYKMYTGQTEIIDEYGNHTGSWKPGYGELKAVKLSVSPNRGSAESEMFGTLDDYDRTMTTADTECEIDEDSILWLDGIPTDGPHNYFVKKRAPWKNSVAYAVKKVEVSNGDFHKAGDTIAGIRNP